MTGEENHNFTWNARMQASLRLPYDISVQTTFNYRSKQVISQGYRKPKYGINLGIRKNFFNKMFTLSINCRDVLNSRKWENETSSPTFTRHQKNWRQSRTVNFTLTWNFGNMKRKQRDGDQRDGDQRDDDEMQNNNSFNGMED